MTSVATAKTQIASKAYLTHKRARWPRIKKHLIGWAFISPWLMGFILLILVPFIASFFLSFTNYGLVGEIKVVGLRNFRQAFVDDPKFYIALRVTLAYALMTVPATTAVAVLVALLLNQPVHGVTFFRGAFYLPSVISGVGIALLWTYMLNRNGPINLVLSAFGIQGPAWLFDKYWALPALAFMNLFSVGSSMLILLAALQGVPQHLYEAVELDGGGDLAKFWHVTIPQISPAVFYNITISTIGVLQSFQQALIMTAGGPGTATLFYGLYLYRNAFEYFQMGYACTLAWVMFILIVGLTVLNFVGARYWVFYEGERST